MVGLGRYPGKSTSAWLPLIAQRVGLQAAEPGTTARHLLNTLEQTVAPYRDEWKVRSI